MLKVGLTGGIGSGKSIVARIFRVLGVPVFEADAEGRRLLKEDAGIISAVADRFGTTVVQDGAIDRAALATRVFNDAAALEALNAIIHPAVRDGFRIWVGRQQAPYVIMEAAILAEHGGHKAMDRMIVVTAPEQVRVHRVMARDLVDEVSVRSRMAHQFDDESRLAIADHVILNDDRKLVIPQVLSVHAAILNFATP